MRYWGKTLRLNDEPEEFNPPFFRYLKDRRRTVDPTTVTVDAEPFGRSEQLFEVLNERRAPLAKYHTIRLASDQDSLVAHLRAQLAYAPPPPTKWELLALTSQPDFPPEAVAKLFSLLNQSY